MLIFKIFKLIYLTFNFKIFYFLYSKTLKINKNEQFIKISIPTNEIQGTERTSNPLECFYATIETLILGIPMFNNRQPKFYS